MEQLKEKMYEYLNMDTEIPFEEFTAYYKKVMDYLKSNYEEMEKENLLDAKFILNIMSSNSTMRAQRKGPQTKKYKKMGEKTSFWGNAINFRLINSGMTQAEIDEIIENMTEGE